MSSFRVPAVEHLDRLLITSEDDPLGCSELGHHRQVAAQ